MTSPKKRVKIEPKEEMFYEGRKVLFVICEESKNDTIKRKNRLKKLGYSNKKPVKRISGAGTIKFYDSVQEAADDTRISYSSVSKCVNKKQATAGGYSFTYI